MVQPHLITALLLLCASVVPASAQKRISADVEVKQMAKNQVMTITKSVYCSNNGRLVVSFHRPEEYVMLTNSIGETKIYSPKTNSVMTDNSGMSSAKDEMLYLYLMGRIDDLGLGLSFYSVRGTRREDGLLVKTFVTDRPDQSPQVEVVYNSDYLPVYCAFYDANGHIITKTYLSHYDRVGPLPFPCRQTTISYLSAKDSTVTRTLYSNFKIDDDDPMYGFEVPENAAGL